MLYDIVTIGELLIDFTPGGFTGEGAVLFAQNAGGGPANLASFAAKLGKNAAFIGKLGEDQFGIFLTKMMNNSGVDTKGLVYTREANTTLAFVHLDDSGDRTFSFCRKPGADMLLNKSEVNVDIIRNARIFHFSTVSMTHNPSREATLFAVDIAKKNASIISFDPNLRLPLWDSPEEAKLIIGLGLKYADILKVSYEELEFITRQSNLEAATSTIYDEFRIPVILVTMGSEGCFYKIGNQTGTVGAYEVKTIDTTGAGDAFLGAYLCKVLEEGIQTSKEKIEPMIAFANAAGSLTTAKKGAIPAMPTLSEIEECMRLNIRSSG